MVKRLQVQSGNAQLFFDLDESENADDVLTRINVALQNGKAVSFRASTNGLESVRDIRFNPAQALWWTVSDYQPEEPEVWR